MFKTKLTPQQITETGIVFALVLIIAGLSSDIRLYYVVSMTLLLLTILFPVLLKPFAYLWFELAQVLSFISSRIILGIIFFLLITPVGLFRKLIGKDRLQLKKFKKTNKSAYIIRDHLITSNDLIYQF